MIKFICYLQFQFSVTPEELVPQCDNAKIRYFGLFSTINYGNFSLMAEISHYNPKYESVGCVRKSFAMTILQDKKTARKTRSPAGCAFLFK